MKTISNSDRIGEENAFAVLARATALAAQGKDIINLGIGQPLPDQNDACQPETEVKNGYGEEKIWILYGKAARMPEKVQADEDHGYKYPVQI